VRASKRTPVRGRVRSTAHGNSVCAQLRRPISRADAHPNTHPTHTGRARARATPTSVPGTQLAPVSRPSGETHHQGRNPAHAPPPVACCSHLLRVVRWEGMHARGRAPPPPCVPKSLSLPTRQHGRATHRGSPTLTHLSPTRSALALACVAPHAARMHSLEGL